MIMKANKQIGFIYKDNESIDKILKDGDVVFERGFLREKTSTTLPITFDGVGKNLKDYKIYGNTKQQLLPSGYTQVDYIETTGTQHIDTGVYGNLNTLLEIKASRTTLDNTNKQLAGSLGNTYSITINIGPVNITRFGTKSYSMKAHDYITADKPSIFICNKNGITIDGNSTGNFNEDTNFITESTLYLMGANGSNTKFPGKLYYTKIYDNNVLIRYFIPCYRNSDNEVGLYDLVNKVFYTNQGTGSFTYGNVAPTPDAPIEMVSCGDRTKNLCRELEQGGYNDTNGLKTTGPNNYRSKEPIKVFPNTNYIFSIDGVGQAINVLEYKSDGTYIGRIGTGAISANTYFTTSSETAYINIFRGTSAGIEKWQIEQNDTISSYEPYGYKIPVNVRSDNLFDKDNANVLNAYIGTNKIITTSEYDKTLYIKCKPNTTYTISKMISSPTNQNKFRVCTTTDIPTIGTTGIDYVGYNTGTKITNITITTSLSANYLCVFMLNVNSSTTTLEEILDSIMIVEGSTTPSKYIPYYNETTNIYLDEPLRKIGDYSDYIDFINGKIVRNIDEIVLDGSENWVTATAGIKKRFVCNTYQNVIIPKNLDTIGNILSNKFISKTANETALKINGIAVAGSGKIVIYYDLTKDYTTEQFKTWLSSNNVTVDYALATPTQESITLPNIPTIDGNNTLNIETEITPSQVYIKYKSNN